MNAILNYREYLFETLDHTDGGHSLPFGPLFMSPKGVAEALLDETLRGPQKQKEWKWGMAAYGSNKDTNLQAYLTASIPREDIYIVNDESVLENAKSGFQSSYDEQADNINELFPFRISVEE